MSLPDLSNASQAVQSQLRERYASMQANLARTDATPGDLASAYGDMGKLLMAAEHLDAAEPAFLNALALQPGELQWPYYLGHLSRLRNDPAKAAPWFEQALRARPDYVPALVWLGDMQLAQNRPDAADPLFRKAWSLDSRSGAALFGLGRVALAKQEYGEAVANLEHALTLAPNASRIHYPLGLAYRGQGDRQKAEAHLKQRGDVEIPRADPLMHEIAALLQNAAAYEVRGAEAMGKRQWAEAVTNLKKAIEVAPSNAFTRLNLGTALYLTNDARGALEQFEAAVRLSPESAKAHYGMGIIMEAKGQDGPAIEHFSAAATYEPDDTAMRISLADALRRNGRLDDSLPHYAHVITIDPSVSQARFGYAMALVRLRRYRDAREWLTQGMKTYPDQPGFAHALARLLAAAPDDRVRDGRTAMAMMEALTQKQKTIGLSETMAMTLAELGRFEDAAAWQRDAIAGANQTQRDALPRLTENLRHYENREPCRTPWRDDDPVFHPRPAR